MKESRTRFFAENMETLSRRDRVFLNNPVIMQGLGLAPIIVPATNIQNALILAVAVALMLTPTRVLANIISRFTGYKFKAVIYVLTAGLVYVGASYIIEYLFGLTAGNVGIYLPLLVTEPLIIKRHTSQQREKVGTSLQRGIISTIGFCLVLFVSAGIRELLAYGTLGGMEVFRFKMLPMADMVAGGFIILGIIAAIWRAGANTFKKRVSMEAKKLQ
ncbi:MAG: Rnf-Nqr domain containing protein [Oscillospiraceae bacterium]